MGAVADALLKTDKFETICDSTVAAIDMWNEHKDNLAQYLEKCAQRSRLRKNGVDQCIDYCITMDTCNVLPMYKDGVITNELY